jgi:hypothetical protein
LFLQKAVVKIAAQMDLWFDAEVGEVASQRRDEAR